MSNLLNSIFLLINVILGFIFGLWDSIKGIGLIFYIDAEICRLKTEKKIQQRQGGLFDYQEPQRTNSSSESSISEAVEKELLYQHYNLSDERNIQNLRKLTYTVPLHEKKIAKQVLKCCALNGGFTWMSIILFEQILLPTLKYVLLQIYGHKSDDLLVIWSWLQAILSILFGMMWVLPIFLLSKIVSSLWFADIANEAYNARKGQPQLIPSISKIIADFLLSMIVQVLFLIQSMLMNCIPLWLIGRALCFVHLCLLYSLYSFEYKWFNMGWELHRRLSYIEINWPYFLGFGLPLTIVTNFSDSLIVSSCIFSIFFPLFILSGNEAKPIVGTAHIPLRLFSPVIFVTNLMFGGRKGIRNSSKIVQTKQSNKKQLNHSSPVQLRNR